MHSDWLILVSSLASSIQTALLRTNYSILEFINDYLSTYCVLNSLSIEFQWISTPSTSDFSGNVGFNLGKIAVSVEDLSLLR